MRPLVQQPETFLRKKGIKASFQRVKIYDYLQKTESHPSVSQIFEELHDQIPSLSRATVYNTINLFVEKRLVNAIPAEGTEARYDLSEPLHAHFQCIKCGKIADIPFTLLEIPKALEGCEVQDYQCFFRGLCSDCGTKRNLS